jgi:hypothetical protein
MTHKINLGFKQPKKFVSKHERHEIREGVYGEYEEDVKEYAKKHPENPKVKSVSIWTIHGKGK